MNSILTMHTLGLVQLSRSQHDRLVAIEYAMKMIGTRYYMPNDADAQKKEETIEGWFEAEKKRNAGLADSSFGAFMVGLARRIAPNNWRRYGTSGDDPIFGYNCSGYCSDICRQVGWIGSNDRLSTDQFYQTFKDKIVDGPPQAGDLIVFGKLTEEGKVTAAHMAFMVTDWTMAEAGAGDPGTDGDIEAANRNAFVRLRPVEWREGERLCIIRLWSEE